MSSLTQNGQALGVAAVFLGYLTLQMMQGRLMLSDHFTALEAQMKRPIALALIIISNGILAGTNAKMPMRITSVLASPWARLAALLVAGFIGAGDIETAVVATALVLVVMQLVRTPQERQRAPFML